MIVIRGLETIKSIIQAPEVMNLRHQFQVVHFLAVFINSLRLQPRTPSSLLLNGLLLFQTLDQDDLIVLHQKVRNQEYFRAQSFWMTEKLVVIITVDTMKGKKRD